MINKLIKLLTLAMLFMQADTVGFNRFYSIGAVSYL